MISTRAILRVVFVLMATMAALYLLYRVRSVVGLVLISVFLAIALGPAVDFFNRRRVPRVASILIVYLLIFLAIFGVGLLIVPPVVSETTALAENVPRYIDELRRSEAIRAYDDRYDLTGRLQEQAGELPRRLGAAAGALQSVTVGVFSTFFQLITVLVMTLFLLLDGKAISNFVFQQLSARGERRAHTIAANIYKAVGGYVTGAFSIALLAGLSTFIVLSLLGVPFAVPLALMMGFLDLIPLVGATVAGVLIAIVCAFQDFPTTLIIWSVWFLVYQQVENNVLQPFVYRRTVALAPLLVIVAVLMGASLLGVLGALLAIPVAAALQILVKDWWHFHHHPTSPVGADHTEPISKLATGSREVRGSPAAADEDERPAGPEAALGPAGESRPAASAEKR